MKPCQKIRKPLPTDQELIEWRESLRREGTQSWSNPDPKARDSWAEPEYNVSATRFAKFVTQWRARHGWSPKRWDILGWSHHVCADQQKLLCEAETACLECGIDPRETTLCCNRHYRYTTNKVAAKEPTPVLLGGDIDVLARWPEIDQWLQAHPRAIWSLRGVICEIDGIDASGAPWSIAALNANPKSS